MEFNQTESTEQFLSGGGEMGKLIRTMDWSKTALGPIETWPQSLRTSVSLCLSSTFPILIAWGPETIQIYNDSYRPICGEMHPQSMGMNFRICWESALEVVGDKFTRGQQGEGTYITDQRMFLERYGYLEEAWMTFSFAPIRDESGGVGGIFHPITETTDKMLSARRTQALRDLGEAFGKAKSVQEIGALTTNMNEDYMLDVPFMMFYQLEGDTAKLINAAGVVADTKLSPAEIDLSNNYGWPLAEVLQTGEMLTVTDLQKRFGDFSCKPYDIAPHTAMVLPVRISGQEQLFGFVIAGVSACRALDNAYTSFYSLLTNTFNTAVSNIYAYEQEQKRAEALAAIDRSKTAFFSNVSHEFRTPLTLMLGPLEDMLAKHNPDFQAPLEATHRNALRLLKLVNNLLDYSRVEAGRTQAAYQLTDICELTTDLASSFRSIIEKVGMQLNVQCFDALGSVYVDRQMWEKIVLNLLSNAFKYTLEGSISVMQQQVGDNIVLQVQDTGVGIPAKELPHMFERFHRVENSAGRTHEGTGIGLSLVHELVNLHGGQIKVDSIEGSGSTFTVTIPIGKAHLPQDRVLEVGNITESSALKGAFLQEAISLLVDETAATPAEVMTPTVNSDGSTDLSEDKNTYVLIADDNADMRAYLVRLLEPYFTVGTAINGKDALAKLKQRLPALLISDVMMPVMDGKVMLNHIRAEARTSRLPVIFLSARAGEEARIDGLEAGADDYLVKPFSAAELLSKVRAQIKISKARAHAEEQLRSLFTKAPVAIAIYRGPEYVIELANQKMLGYWGVNEQEVVGRPILEVLPTLAAQGFDQVMNQIYRSGEGVILNEIQLVINRDSKPETIYINLNMEAVREENGRISGIMAVAADVSEQVTARKDIERANSTLSLAMEASGMGMWSTYWGTNSLDVSERARLIHGIQLDSELTFDGTLEVVIPEHRERFVNAVTAAVNSKGRFNEDYQIQPFDGSRRKWLNSTGQVELDELGEVKSVIGTILDITEKKEDDMRKNDFIGMVSHELKTPLTTLSGYTQVMHLHAKRNEDAIAQNHLSKVMQQIKKMTAMINGFLNVSRLESGKIQLQKQEFNLTALVEEVITETELTGKSHEINFHSTAPISVEADRDKVGVVVSNLLTNAIKYAPAGSTITLATEVKDHSAIISVKDQGIGIKPDDLKRLFDRFYRVDDQRTQYIAGFGIGLYLSDEIVKRHNGHIWAESEPGHGSTFYVSLPLGE